MHKRMWKYLVLLMVIPGLLVTVSCGKKAIQSEPVVTSPSSDEAAAQQAEMERQRRLAEEKRLQEEALLESQRLKEAAVRAEHEAKHRFLNDDVYFDYDSATLSMEAQTVLKAKAQWLSANPDTSAVIEGHCDERGTSAYNLALGDRRALSAKNFLVRLGIESDRLSTISYGEERPAVEGHTESAWSQNRRAHFILQ